MLVGQFDTCQLESEFIRTFDGQRTICGLSPHAVDVFIACSGRGEGDIGAFDLAGHIAYGGGDTHLCGIAVVLYVDHLLRMCGQQCHGCHGYGYNQPFHLIYDGFNSI